MSFFAFIVGILAAIIIFNRDHRLEKYYSNTVKAIIRSAEHSYILSRDIPREIIVDSGTKSSRFLTFLKKKIASLSGKIPTPIIFIFEKNTEDEQKAFIIQKAFDSVCDNKLLDLSFLESLKYYLAYKYAHDVIHAEENIIVILRKDFEESKYREYIKRLDSLDFKQKSVLNLPPEEGPLLTDLLLPMAKELERELISKKVLLLVFEEYKTFLMELIYRICLADCAIIFIGNKLIDEYIVFINNNLDRFNFFIIAARGSHIKVCSLIEREIFEKKWKKDSYKTIDIKGSWRMPNGEERECLWKLILKLKIFSIPKPIT